MLKAAMASDGGRESSSSELDGLAAIQQKKKNTNKKQTLFCEGLPNKFFPIFVQKYVDSSVVPALISFHWYHHKYKSY